MAMLKSLGKVSLLLRFGRRVCVCLPNEQLEDDLRERIRPLVVGHLACWCDKQPAE